MEKKTIKKAKVRKASKKGEQMDGLISNNYCAGQERKYFWDKQITLSAKVGLTSVIASSA